MLIKDLSQLDFTNIEKSKAGGELETKRKQWLKERNGFFTASEIVRLMSQPRLKAHREAGQLSSGARAYCREVLASKLTSFQDENYTSPAMKNGIEYEEEAVKRFTEETGLLVSFCNDNQEFIKSQSLLYGGTPDGIVGGNIPLEIKCPDSKTHINYLQIKSAKHLKKVSAKYYWQIMCQISLAGGTHAYFMSYDHRFKDKCFQSNIVKIQANSDDIDFMTNKIIDAHKYMERFFLRMGTEYPT